MPGAARRPGCHLLALVSRPYTGPADGSARGHHLTQRRDAMRRPRSRGAEPRRAPSRLHQRAAPFPRCRQQSRARRRSLLRPRPSGHLGAAPTRSPPPRCSRRCATRAGSPTSQIAAWQAKEHFGTMAVGPGGRASVLRLLLAARWPERPPPPCRGAAARCAPRPLLVRRHAVHIDAVATTGGLAPQQAARDAVPSSSSPRGAFDSIRRGARALS
jgi:hypothetical protein